MVARCISCDCAQGDDEVSCLFTEERLGTLEDLLHSDTPSSCPLEKKKGGRNTDETDFVYPESCKSSTEDSCFKTQYSKKRACLKCERATECARAWSEGMWNTHKKRSYGRVETDVTGNSWDDTVKTIERD